MDNLKQQAYSIIKAKILNCDYAPDTLISEKIITDEIGMSRTPIRDALSRLEQEGLLEILPKRGVRISKFTFKDINNLFVFRRFVETFVVSSFAYRLPKAEIQVFHDLFSNPAADRQRANEMDDQFHDMLIVNSQNDYIIQSYDLMKNQIRRLRVFIDRCQSDDRYFNVARAQHLEITTALLADDNEKAAEMLSSHLTNYFNYALSLLTQDYSIDI